MAAGPLLVSEPLHRYRALGLGGDPVWRAAGQLRAAIANRLSHEHADLLAIPQAEPSGRSIDWYAPFEGEVRRLADLDAVERTRILDMVHRLHGDLAGLATAMETADRSGAERNFARLLRHALTAPGEETLYVVDGRPVMTFWGFTTDATLPGVFLAGPPAAAPAVTPAVPAAAARPAIMASAPAVAAPAVARTAWWQWVLLALILLLLLALLAWLVRPYLPRIEPVIEAAARERALTLAVRQPLEFQHTRVSTLQQDNEDLRLELARLTDELARRGGDCAAGVIGPGGVIVGAIGGPPIERSGDPDGNSTADAAVGAKEADGKGADMKGPDDKSQDDKSRDGQSRNAQDQDKDKGKDSASKDEPKKDEPKPMVVPPDAKQKQDLAFLKGDWRSRTGLATATGEKDLRPSYTLDDKGKGKVTFVQKNGASCEAPAEARWDNGKLIIEEKSNPKCTDGRIYVRNTVNCEIGADGVAQCSGSQPGDKRSYRVQIGR